MSTTSRLVTASAVLAVAVAGTFELMCQDAHALLLGAFGAACGAGTGVVLQGRPALVPGAVLGFLAPVAYLPVWLALDLPPVVGLDL